MPVIMNHLILVFISIIIDLVGKTYALAQFLKVAKLFCFAIYAAFVYDIDKVVG